MQPPVTCVEKGKADISSDQRGPGGGLAEAGWNLGGRLRYLGVLGASRNAGHEEVLTMRTSVARYFILKPSLLTMATLAHLLRLMRTSVARFHLKAVLTYYDHTNLLTMRTSVARYFILNSS